MTPPAFVHIVSQSGTTHYINPTPNFGGGFKTASFRTQTLCDMHLDNTRETEPNGDFCEFCDKVAQQRNKAVKA